MTTNEMTQEVFDNFIKKFKKFGILQELVEEEEKHGKQKATN